MRTHNYRLFVMFFKFTLLKSPKKLSSSLSMLNSNGFWPRARRWSGLRSYLVVVLLLLVVVLVWIVANFVTKRSRRKICDISMQSCIEYRILTKIAADYRRLPSCAVLCGLVQSCAVLCGLVQSFAVLLSRSWTKVILVLLGILK